MTKVLRPGMVQGPSVSKATMVDVVKKLLPLKKRRRSKLLIVHSKQFRGQTLATDIRMHCIASAYSAQSTAKHSALNTSTYRADDGETGSASSVMKTRGVPGAGSSQLVKKSAQHWDCCGRHQNTEIIESKSQTPGHHILC